MEIGSNMVLDRSENVRSGKKGKVSCISISLVFAEALLLSEGCCGPDTGSVKKILSLCQSEGTIQEHTCACVLFVLMFYLVELFEFFSF